MNATLIGVSSGVFTILIFAIFKRLDKDVVYGLILAAIGFLYVGYTWSDISALIINLLQALLFLMFAYFGIKKNSYFLIAGYLLHGLWDLLYGHVGDPSLIPPNYDWFCSTYDFIIGFYLLWYKFQKRTAMKELIKPNTMANRIVGFKSGGFEHKIVSLHSPIILEAKNQYTSRTIESKSSISFLNQGQRK